nr:2,3-bisphosphoglycerate-dependent phosphoglycerate mutase [uncultured Emticicia sp.]
MALLLLVRHGQSTYNLENRFTGNLDVPLTPLGEEEALLAGKKLINFHIDFAYTSILVRACETLRIILKEIKQTNIPIIKNAALNERMYGSLQGQNKAETALKYGDHQVELWRRSYEIRPPEGESLHDTYNRAVPYYQQEIEPKLKNYKNILIVAHGNSLRALKMYLEDISPENILKVNIQTGAPLMYVFNENLKNFSVKNL